MPFEVYVIHAKTIYIEMTYILYLGPVLNILTLQFSSFKTLFNSFTLFSFACIYFLKFLFSVQCWNSGKENAKVSSWSEIQLCTIPLWRYYRGNI